MPVQIKIKLRGVRSILNSQGVTAELAKAAARGARAAGVGFERKYQPHGRYKSRWVVRTADSEGRMREANEKVLIRALDAMR